MSPGDDCRVRKGIHRGSEREWGGPQARSEHYWQEGGQNSASHIQHPGGVCLAPIRGQREGGKVGGGRGGSTGKVGALIRLVTLG